MRIQILPKDLAEKIAAGEVVERPSSVVKELVENSIDAGATLITIELQEGGKTFLSITDNGSGIPEEDLAIALERHATSKIQNLDDLWNLSSMGFRGEALPSIAAISRFTLESKFKKGRSLYLEGGKIIRDEKKLSGKIKTPTGTRVVVEDLFFNVPARLKFLKSKASENSTIRDLIERLSVCHPQIGFQLFIDSRKALDLPPAQSVQERFADILEVPNLSLESFSSRFEDISIEGFLDQNERARNSNSIFLSVNKRMVRDKLLISAVQVALRPRMMEGEYPRLYLNVEVLPSEVDVNVHPAKSEVRFRRSKDVFQVIHGALEKISKASPQNSYTVSESKLDLTPTVELFAPKTEPLFKDTRVQYQTRTSFYPSTSTPSPSPTTRAAAFQTHSHTETEPVTETEPSVPSASLPVSPSSPLTRTANFSSLHYIGQLKNTYLLFQDDKGLVLIDQHAAHERINYEKIKTMLFKNGLTPQPLLIAAVYKCKKEDIDVALENEEVFEKLGFHFEAFGETSILIRESPQEIDFNLALDFFKSVLENLKSNPEIASNSNTDPARLSLLLERVLATAACHASIRAGQALSARQAEELVHTMENTESALNCPHGRPASIRLDFHQIEGLFKR